MEAKRLLRSWLLTARATRSPDELAAAGRALAIHAVAAWGSAGSVATYAGSGSEPPTRPLVDGLHDRGVRVLLPVVDGDGMRWAPYGGWDALVEGAFGLLQPASPPLPGDPVRDVDVVVAPALAVDRRGHRLGRGGGYFDRAVAGLPPERLVAVVFDDEVVDDVPTEPHDITVGAVLTPSGLQALTAR